MLRGDAKSNSIAGPARATLVLVVILAIVVLSSILAQQILKNRGGGASQIQFGETKYQRLYAVGSGSGWMSQTTVTNFLTIQEVTLTVKCTPGEDGSGQDLFSILMTGVSIDMRGSFPFNGGRGSHCRPFLEDPEVSEAFTQAVSNLIKEHVSWLGDDLTNAIARAITAIAKGSEVLSKFS